MGQTQEAVEVDDHCQANTGQAGAGGTRFVVAPGPGVGRAPRSNRGTRGGVRRHRLHRRRRAARPGDLSQSRRAARSWRRDRRWLADGARAVRRADRADRHRRSLGRQGQEHAAVPAGGRVGAAELVDPRFAARRARPRQDHGQLHDARTGRRMDRSPGGRAAAQPHRLEWGDRGAGRGRRRRRR